MDLAPILPTFFKSPPPAMPITIVENTSGAMMDLIRFRKISRMKESEEENSGAIHPRNTPNMRPKKICLGREICHHGLFTDCSCMLLESKKWD